MRAPQYAIIGYGRMAQHFCYYLECLNLKFTHWHRNTETSLESVVSSATHVIILITDSQIDPFIKQNQEILKNKRLIHFSGALQSELAYTAHPLMTFGKLNYSLEDYQKIPFIIEQEGPAFTELLPILENPHYSIPKQQKNYYHSLCVLANNFTTLLWQKFFNELQYQFSIPHEAGIPLLKQTLHNLTFDYKNALTGPLTRKDFKTLDQNLEALKEDEFHEVFKAFIKTIHPEKGNSP